MTAAPTPRHVRHGTVVRWIDADTVVVEIDLDFNVRVVHHLRLKDCWALELDTPLGLRALSYVNSLAPPGSRVIVETYRPRPETLGRYLARVWMAGALTDINGMLVRLEYATLERTP